MPWFLLALGCATPPATDTASPELTVYVVHGPDRDDDGSPPSWDCNDLDPRIGDRVFGTGFSGEDVAAFEHLAPRDLAGGRTRPVPGLRSFLVADAVAGDIAVQAVATVDDAGGDALVGVLGRISPAGAGLREGLRCALALGPDGPVLELARVTLDAGRGTRATEVLADLGLPDAPDLAPGATLALALWTVGDRLACTLETEDGDAYLVAADAPAGPAAGTAAIGATARHAALDELRACRAWMAPTEP